MFAREGAGRVNWESAIRAELQPLAPYEPGLRARDVRDRTRAARILKLSSNEHPCGPFPSAIRGMRSVLPRLNRYPDGMAHALRRELAARLGVPASQVVVGSGSNELIRLIAQAVLRPGDEVVFAWPSFVVYPMVTQMFGAVPVNVPLTADDVHDLEAMAAAITPKTRIVFLCNPNNPTGTIYRRDAFERFLQACPDDVLVIVDEAYYEFATDDGYPDTLASFDGVCPIAVLRTFSKIYSLAGLRIGYGVAPEPLVRAVDTAREPFNVTTIAQVAAYYSLGDADEVARRREDNLVQKETLYRAFRDLGVSFVPSETNFVYVKTQRSVEVFDALLDEGVIVRDFGNAAALRVGIGTETDTYATIEAFGAVADRLGEI